MRQAGILAAAGIYALDHNISRLKEDHAKAKFLATELSKVPSFSIDMESVQTNIIIIDLQKSGKRPEEVLSQLREKGVLLTVGNYMGIRAVTHMDVSMEDVQRAAHIIQETIQ
jgi:threonine aldolase